MADVHELSGNLSNSNNEFARETNEISQSSTLQQVDNFDKEIFLEEVRKYRCLWDVNSDSYKMRPIKQNAWIQMATTFNRDVEFLQRSLKNLKDNLKKCLDKRQQMARSGAPASSLPQCKYFEQMRFLHEKTANQPTDSNIIPSSQELSTVRKTLNPTTHANNATTVSNSTKRKADDEPLVPPLSSRHTSKSSRQDAIDLAILKQLDKTDKKIDETISKEETTDEVSLYCRSLIPSIRALPLKKRRMAMIKIRQTLFEIEFNDE